MRLRRLRSLILVACVCPAVLARAQSTGAPQAVEPPSSFAEHVARRASLTAPLVDVRHHDWKAPQPYMSVVCGFGREPEPPRLVRVTIAGGAPARGAFVVRTEDEFAMPMHVEPTDDDGIARLSIDGDEPLRIELDGCFPVENVRFGERARLDVELTPGVEILRGRVLDPAGKPIVGAEVTLETASTAWRAWTDSWGQYRVLAREPVSLPRELRFRVRDAWRRPFLGEGRSFAIERAPGADSVELTLLDLRTVAFDVLDANGNLVLDVDVRIAWDREHAERHRFPFDAPRLVAPTSRSEAIAATVRGIPVAVPLWVEVFRGGERLVQQPFELPLEAATPRFVTPRVEVRVPKLPERVRGAVFRVVDAQGRECPHVEVVLVAHRIGGDERERCSVDDLARVRIDERDVETTVELWRNRRLLLHRRFPAGFDSAQIVELVVDAR